MGLEDRESMHILRDALDVGDDALVVEQLIEELADADDADDVSALQRRLDRGRGGVARVLDQLTEQRRSPVRVEVREADGTVFTDIITPSRRRRTEPDPEPASEEPARRPAAELVALHGEGFVPGEDVAIAVVIAHGDAAPDGTMRGLVEAHQLAGTPTREVILLGRVSGTVTIGHPE